MSSKNNINLILIGDSAVGKTSLLARFDKNKFIMAKQATMGLDYIRSSY